MSTSLLVGEFGSAFASCASGFIVVLVACMTIFYLFRGSIQDPDSKRRPLSIFSINHSATQSAKSANQKIKHKLNKPSAGKRGAKCSAGAPHSPKGIVKKSDTEAVHQRSSPPPTLKSEDAKPLTVEQTVTPKTTPIEDTIENLCTVHPVELGPETSVSSEPPAQPPPPQQQQAAKKPQVKKQSSTRGNNQKKSVEFHGSGNVSATVVGNALPSVTHVSALTDMQAKVKLLEKLVKHHKADLESSRQEAARARSETTKLRQFNEEVNRALETLKDSVAELTKRNSIVCEDKCILENKAKSLELNCCNLRSQLSLTATEAEKQKIRDANQIDDLKVQIANLMDHLQRQQRSSTKELAISGENYFLKGRLDQLNMEVQQLKSTNANQQNELTSLRASRLDEQLANRNTMTNLNNLRVRNAQLEAQLQQYTMEFDRVNQRNQEYGSALTALQAERLDKDLKQTRIISSLQFQFGDLNSEKQRLSEAVLEQRSTLERTVSELRAQVLRLEGDLGTARDEVATQTSRADALAARLEEQKEAASAAPRVPPPLKKEEVGDGIDDVVRRQHEQQRRELSERLAQLEVALTEAQEEAAFAKRQQELLQSTLMQTESVLARLQRSIEEEEEIWRSRLVSTEAENQRLRNDLSNATATPPRTAESPTSNGHNGSSVVRESPTKATSRIEPADALLWDDATPDCDEISSSSPVDHRLLLDAGEDSSL